LSPLTAISQSICHPHGSVYKKRRIHEDCTNRFPGWSNIGRCHGFGLPYLFQAQDIQIKPYRYRWLFFLANLPVAGRPVALYVIAADFLGFNALSLPLVSLYMVLLWLSMLFIALPLSGEGTLGGKSGPMTWLEQLILHIVFGGLYYMALKGLL
jgi:hypothetical protein